MTPRPSKAWFGRVGFLVGFVIVASIPAANAMAANRLAGEITFTDARAAEVATVDSASLDALSLLPEPAWGRPASWTVVAPTVTVNWTRRELQTVGFTPNDGQALAGAKVGDYSGEDRYQVASISLEPRSPSVNFLLVANGSSTRFSGLRTGPLEFAPSAGESWRGGIDGRSETTVASGTNLHGAHDVSKGTPRAQFRVANGIEVRGDFSLYVWSALVNVTGTNGTVNSYRSGEWDSAVVGGQVHERGVTRKENGQLLRLDFKEGVLVMASWAGLARFAANGIEAHVEGDAVFHGATGYLESDRHYFRSENESVAVGGSVSLSVRPSPASSSRLIAAVTARGAETSLQPSGPLLLPAPNRIADVEPASGADAKATLPLPQAGWSFPELVAWLAVAALLASAASFVLLLRRARAAAAQDVEALLQRAEGALVRGDPATARAFARPVLRRQRANVDAWFVHGASLLREGAHRRAVKDLEAAMKGIRVHRAGLAFLLTISYLNLGRLGPARRWARVAATDPDFRLELDEAEQFASLRRRRPAPAAASPRWAKDSAADAAYR